MEEEKEGNEAEEEEEEEEDEAEEDDAIQCWWVSISPPACPRARLHPIEAALTGHRTGRRSKFKYGRPLSPRPALSIRLLSSFFQGRLNSFCSSTPSISATTVPALPASRAGQTLLATLTIASCWRRPAFQRLRE